MVAPRAAGLAGLIRRLEKLIRATTVIVFGCGPSLKSGIREMAPLLPALGSPTIAADGATSALLEAGVRPDIIVTDLDGNVSDIAEASRDGSIVLLHAHGDNMDSVVEWLPRIDSVLPLTQTEPTALVRNFGGFTDGDKCLYLAAAFGAAQAIIIGMDFDQRMGSRSDPFGQKDETRKLRKLSIGRLLTEELIRQGRLDVLSTTTSSIEGVGEIGRGPLLERLGRRDP
jgi:uncharacterized Rossmann fold enzyme